MNYSKKMLIGVLGMGLVTAGMLVSGADTNRSSPDHLAQAASYEQKAKEQQVLIDEHNNMKLMQTNDTITPQPIIRKQNEHCERIVTDATKLRDDLLDFAKWHRMRVSELAGN